MKLFPTSLVGSYAQPDWLIRRDMATDPTAGGGAVRSYFLNVTQLLAVLTAIGTAAAGITQLGDRYNSSTYSFSVALSTAGLFALLEWERRRTRATTSGAVALQRLHHYGAQLVIVFIATPFWFQAIQDVVLTVLARSGAYNPCSGYSGGFITCDPGSYYPLRQTVALSFYGLLLALLFFAFQAPDVALSAIVVGSVALPLMILLALGKVREARPREPRPQEAQP